MKEPKQPHWIFFKKILRRNSQPLTVHDKATEGPPPIPPAYPGQPAFVLLIGFENCAEDPGQIPGCCGHRKIVPHEACDAAATGMIGVAHPPPDLSLQVEGQPLLRTTGEVMDVATNGPKELLGTIESLRLFRRQHPQLYELADIVGAIDVFGYPKQCVQVSEPALTLLDVGLELVTAVADSLVPRIPFGELACDELRRTTLYDVRIKASFEFIEEGLFAPYVARLQQSGADRQIGSGLTEAFVDGPGRLPDLEAKVPQQIKEILDNLLGMGSSLVRQQEQELDIGIGRQFASPIAPHCNDSQPLARRRVGERVDYLGHEIEQRADQLIHQEALLADRCGAVAGRLEAAMDLCSALCQSHL